MEEYIEKHKGSLIELTKKLVAIATVNPPGARYEEMVDFLERHCKRLRLATRRITVPKKELEQYGIETGSERINLLAYWYTGAKKTIHINCHYDVVPATGNWKTDPFKPIVKNGRIYGRGTEDMKANIAATLMAVEALKANKITPCCNIEFSFTPDEETGGRTGFGYLVRKGYIKADYAIGEGYHNDFISYGNKGLVWFKVEVLGRSCHSSEPYKGINSFEKMVSIANEFMKLKRKITKRKTVFNTKKDIDRHPTMVMGGELSGGHKTNIVPDRSVFTIDRRVLPEEDLESVKKEIFSAIGRLRKTDKELKVKVHVISEERPVISDAKNALYSEFSHAIKKIIGKKPRYALLTGATDMRFLMRKGIPCAGYSVIGGDICHSDNEYVKIKSLIDTAKILANVIAKVR